MKLDDWKFRKNTSRNTVREARRQPNAVRKASITPPDMSPSPDVCSQMLNEKFLPTFPTSLRESWLESFQSISSHAANPIYWICSSPNMAHETASYSLYNLPSLRANLFEETPLINSSLMFFSSRRPVDSLQLLAKSPELAPQALEIVLRNWKPGLDHMFYISRFLQESSCCRTIVGVNRTRWSDSDETLFDLVDEFVPEEDQNFVRRALLRADLNFRHPLEILQAPWADTWRLAIHEKSWQDAKRRLLTMNVRDQLLRCALGVVAEAVLKFHDLCLQMFEPKDPSYIHSLQQKSLILDYCVLQKLEINFSLQEGSNTIIYALEHPSQ